MRTISKPGEILKGVERTLSRERLAWIAFAQQVARARVRPTLSRGISAAESTLIVNGAPHRSDGIDTITQPISLSSGIVVVVIGVIQLELPIVITPL